MKDRIYSLAWRVLPYVCCLPAAAMLGVVVLQLSGAAQ